MSIQEYEILVSVALAALLTCGPWMFMVHGKLAVLVTKTAELCDKVEKAADAQQRLWQQTTDQQSRLDRHEVQLDYLDERLRQLEPTVGCVSTHQPSPTTPYGAS